MSPELALQALAVVTEPHLVGHTCTDGRWWNPRTGTKTPCPVYLHLVTVTQQVQRLAEQVHVAAHQPRHVEAVASGLLAGTPLAELPPEEREGWVTMAQQAISALAVSLDGNQALTDRATAAAGRVDA